MSAVHITAVNVLDNPAAFLNPLQFEIHYECLADLQEGAVLRTMVMSEELVPSVYPELP